MKNAVKLDTYYFPWELEQAISGFVTFYNSECYHESLDKMTPAAVYAGRSKEIATEPERIKHRTMVRRRSRHQQTTAEAVGLRGERSLFSGYHMSQNI